MDSFSGPVRVSGYLQIAGEGRVAVGDLRELLDAVEQAYAAVYHVDLVLLERVQLLRGSERWVRRWGPPEAMMGWPLRSVAAALPAATGSPASPILVSKVVFRSPGFWEFVGALNPLEVLRQYLNDRHERKKDNEYRSAAERDSLAIENAVRAMDALERLYVLEERTGPFGDDLQSVDRALREQVAGALRPSLRRLGQMTDNGLIDGGSARTSSQPPPELERGDEQGPNNEG